MTFNKDLIAELNVNSMDSLIDAFDHACAEFADREAFTAIGKTITFTELEMLSRQFAAYLLNHCDLDYGDRIAIQLPNLVQYPIVAWGILRAGFVLVNTNPLYTPREMKHQFNDAGVKVLIVLSDLLPAVEAIIDETGIEKVVVTHAIDMLQPQELPETKLSSVIAFFDALKHGEGQELPWRLNSFDDLAVLQYTGGTTGVSKGAMLTQGNIFSASLQSNAGFRHIYTEPEVGIAPMPLYHVYGFTVSLISSTLNGVHTVLIPNPRDLDSIITVMKAYPFTGFAGVNTLFAGLMQHPEFGDIDFSHLLVTVSGGTTLVTEIAKAWKQITNSEIYEGYGLSETSAVACVNTPGKNQIGTVGSPVSLVEIKLVDENKVTVADGERGELLIRGPHVTSGYWNRPEATAKVIDSEGWFSTGDVAIRQTDGVIRIVDRIKDMILVSGFNVYPNEIEAVVYSHPDILECAAIGVTDEKTGEAVKLFVVSQNPELTADELIAYCREQLTAYKVPKQIEFRTELPKSPVGKILRRLLRDVG